MRQIMLRMINVCVVCLFLVSLAQAAPCPSDSVQVGTTCVDEHESSLWSIPVTNKGLINKVKKGKADLDDLLKAGAVQVGCTFAPYSHAAFPASFPPTGNWTAPLYAVSIPGVLPTACVTWFQAEQACALSDKGLLTNQQWQRAAASTPDGAPCNVSGGSPALTGAAPGCVSAWGALDMVGNVWEWVADWVPPATSCSPALFGTGDFNCMTIDPTAGFTPSGPAALIRGGIFALGTSAGVFAVGGSLQPSSALGDVGFRCAR